MPTHQVQLDMDIFKIHKNAPNAPSFKTHAQTADLPWSMALVWSQSPTETPIPARKHKISGIPMKYP